MSARKLDFLQEEKEELLRIFQLNLSKDEEAKNLAKSLLETSSWGNRWEITNPKYNTMIVHVQTYGEDVLKIAYEWKEGEWFGKEYRNNVSDLLLKWIAEDSAVYIGQEF